MGRNVTLDFSAGGGSDTEFLIGTITLEPTAVHEIGNRVVLPAPRATGINAGVGVLEDVAISPSGPEPAWAYRATVRDSISGKAQSWLVGVPTGTTAIPFKQLTKFTTTIPPQTTAGMMQNWANTTEANADRSELAADRAEAPTDLMNKTLIENSTSLTAGALSAAIGEQLEPVSDNADVARAESSNAVSRVAALETLGGIAPGDVSDATIGLHVDQPNSDARLAVQKTVFNVPSNLIDLNKITRGFVYSQGSGVLTANAFYTVTDWIPVHAGRDYTYTGLPLRVTFFNSGKAYVDSFSFPSSPYTRTTPVGASWARVSVGNTELPTVQMNAGQVAQPYDLGGTPILRAEDLPEISGQLIQNGSIDPDKTTFFDRSTNLFDPEDLLAGHVISEGKGTPTPNGSYSVTGEITVVAGAEYTYFPATRITYFDSSGAYLGFSTGTVTAPDTFTAPIGASYVRVSLRNQDVSSFQMNAGAILLPYEKGATLTLKESMLPGGSGGGNGFFIDTAGLEQVYTAPVIAAQPGLYTTTASDVYGWYNTLQAAHPQYVTRKDLGASQDGAHRLYSYTLKAPEVPTDHLQNSTLNKTPIPVLLLMAGVHGYEKASVYHLWRLAKALCEEWQTSPVLDAMRWGFEVVIVPIGNPWSYDAMITDSSQGRYNARGVDIARNFPEKWSASSPFPGSAPLSEAETVILNDLITDLAPRAIGGMSFHNFGVSAESTKANMIWQAAASDLTLDLGKQVIKRMSRKWKAEQTWITNQSTYYGYSDMGAPAGSEGQQMTASGFPGSTFEVSSNQRLDGGAGAAHTQEAMTLGFEACVNYIALLAQAGLNYRGRTVL